MFNDLTLLFSPSNNRNHRFVMGRGLSMGQNEWPGLSLDFSSSHCSSIPSMGEMWKTNKNKQEQRRDSQSRRRSPSPTCWSENTSGLEPQRPLQLRALWLRPEGRRFPRGRPGSDSGYLITAKLASPGAPVPNNSRLNLATLSCWNLCDRSRVSQAANKGERVWVHLPLNLTLLTSQEIVLWIFL